MLVRFEPEADPPPRLDRLHQRLQDPEQWEEPGVYPHVPGASTIMLLHETGRYVFSKARATEGPIDHAAADFIGIPRYSVTMLSPSGETCENFTHRGTSIRGVVACVNSADIRAGKQILFLDLRQVAGSIHYVVLDDDHIAYEDLWRLMPREPPAGWRHTCSGGRRHRAFLRVSPGETLVFGFVRAGQWRDGEMCTSDSDSEDDDDGEDGEDEERGSQSSVRSRSRDRGRGSSPPSAPSADAAGDTAQDAFGKSSYCFQAWVAPDCIVRSHSQGLQWPLFEDLVSLLKPTECARVSYTGCILEAKVSDRRVGLSDEFRADQVNAPRLPIDPAAWRWGPDGLEPPHLQQPRPPHGFVVQLQQPEIRATFLLYAFEYAPEVVTVNLKVPAQADQAITAVQAARSDPAKTRFPCLTPVYPQPYVECAIAVVTQEWCRDAYVFFDLGRMNGTLFSVHVAPRIDYESLVAIADLPLDAHLHVFVAGLQRPLQPNEAVDMHTGMCVSFVPAGRPSPLVVSLHDMLQSPFGWHEQDGAPYPPGRWIHLLTDMEPCRFRLNPSRRIHLRQDIAELIAADTQHLTLRPSEPRIADHLDNGVLAHSVLVATEALDRRAPEGSNKIVYVLDMRPISCGLTWGLAWQGLVWAQPIVDHCDSFSPPGFRTQISGGLVEHTDEGLLFRVVEGGVLWVDFVPREVLSSATEDSDSEDASQATSDGDSSDSSTATRETDRGRGSCRPLWRAQ